ncbi:hypothetical protein [Paludibaculum fermentans]|uniref:Glycoside hydrolase family 42 N-terminal domain-containing protein n=1 Tax=Paludibaculum fermentans TaxID=1473598 RepID=A0A7S7SKJ2_PALFE|nr:hypothetical protein [Paludibaculum fermentans]QOY89227.1 hypothetical protein IRI77_04520 [Paludibaculum fermentans]
MTFQSRAGAALAQWNQEHRLALITTSLLLAVQLSACVPARWPSADVESLSLLKQSPINCLLVDSAVWKSEFAAAAKGQGITVLATKQDGASLAVFEAPGGAALFTLTARAKMPIEHPGEVLGTTQGVWPGVRAEEKGAVQARPSSSPWVDTNSGFLRFTRSVTPPATALWLANTPPEKTILGAERYIQAVADAAMAGARWVVALDPGYWDLLRKGDEKAVAGWRRINAVLKFYEDHKDIATWPDFSGLAVLQDASSGALMSGSILDMIAAKHIPARVVTPERLPVAAPKDVRLLLNIDPSALSQEQKDAVRGVARKGATVLSGPPAWKMAIPEGDSITFPETSLKQMEEIWREINGVIGRRNFAARLFGAPSMLSNLKGDPTSGKLALHLVNYSDYPVENITVHLLGKYKSATLITPAGTKKLEIYDAEDETGIDLDKVTDVAIVLLEVSTVN